MSQVFICPSCNEEVESLHGFCPACGEELKGKEEEIIELDTFEDTEDGDEVISYGVSNTQE
jgi:predicted amidophosphoribosyltransferase